MRAQLRSVLSADVDIDDYVPSDPEDDAVWLQFLVGPRGSIGEESFQVLVCTPLWLRREVMRHGPQIGLHHLIVEPLDLLAAIRFIQERIERLDAPDWPELGEKIGRIGQWEFEDYAPTRSDVWNDRKGT
ncbi:MAG: immunity 8 family protein [Bifidobacteriaceae bacterium]|jgi:hypothetical protein|nr:immunity 8 family protein [Bifidobacteriaceae bacterium]